ncbi:nucleotidyltransferase family protein [Sinanaerobacter chloroacetimidivorans]|nr:nucleotidyltransferase domain-containing protein [Sinanaerobacter chloroacetimidivorans]
MMFGLNENEVQIIQRTLAECPELEKAIVFGSRAMGNYKTGSDIDLALFGKGISRKTILDLYDQLNEVLNLPYHFDIIDYHGITNEALKKHIDDIGISIWENKNFK